MFERVFRSGKEVENRLQALGMVMFDRVEKGIFLRESDGSGWVLLWRRKRGSKEWAG